MIKSKELSNSQVQSSKCNTVKFNKQILTIVIWQTLDSHWAVDWQGYSSGSSYAFFTKWSRIDSCQSVTRQLSGSCQTVVRQSPGSSQAVVRQSPNYNKYVAFIACTAFEIFLKVCTLLSMDNLYYWTVLLSKHF